MCKALIGKLLINPFMPNGLFYHNSLDLSISNTRGVWLVLPYFIEIPAFNTNNVDLDQTQHFTDSGIGVQFANVLFMRCYTCMN